MTRAAALPSSAAKRRACPMGRVTWSAVMSFQQRMGWGQAGGRVAPGSRYLIVRTHTEGQVRAVRPLDREDAA
ncbi:hypothetical protein GCM10010326_00220 [Streptomyces xanthochromogenes]|uniref:Uncharacterized protein n=1 Tax=Streptomyces xanthochromogenes TaxID=67384 RepID=A0ABQ2ZGU4_9ACTN|nr:hypothetical protein GCM10010326_00220 [Streptomyces xanthochromogenes]